MCVGAREPEIGNLREHPALVRDRIRQYDVKGRQPIGRHDEHVLIIDGIDVAHLATMDEGQSLTLESKDSRRHGSRGAEGGGW